MLIFVYKPTNMENRYEESDWLDLYGIDTINIRVCQRLLPEPKRESAMRPLAYVKLLQLTIKIIAKKQHLAIVVTITEKTLANALMIKMTV